MRAGRDSKAALPLAALARQLFLAAPPRGTAGRTTVNSSASYRRLDGTT